MRPSNDKELEFSVADGETERHCANGGDIDKKKVKRSKIGADKEMMRAFLSSLEFNPYRLRSGKEMPAIEMNTRVSPKKRLNSSVLNEVDFKMVDLGDDYGPSIIGRRVEVYWPDSKRWFRGRVKAFDHQKMIHKIDYDDGDIERLDLRNEVFRMEVYPGECVNIKPESNIKAKTNCQVAKGNETEEGDGVDSKRDFKTGAGIVEENCTSIYQTMSDVIKPKDMITNEGNLESEDLLKLRTKQHFDGQAAKKQVWSSSEKKELPLDQLTCTNYYVRRKRATTSNSSKESKNRNRTIWRSSY